MDVLWGQKVHYRLKKSGIPCSTKDVHGVTELTVICAVTAECTKQIFQSRGLIPNGRNLWKNVKQGTEIRVHETSKSPILKYANIQSNVFRLSFLLKYNYIRGSTGVKLIYHLGKEGIQSEEKIVTTGTPVTKKLKKKRKIELLNLCPTTNMKSKRWLYGWDI